MSRVVGVFTTGLLVVAIALLAYEVERRLSARRSLALRALAIVVGSASIACLAFHLLSAFHAFRPAPVVVLCGVAVLAFVMPARILPRIRRNLGSAARMATRIRRSPFRPGVLAAGLGLTIVTLHSLILPPIGWDSLTYHAVKSALWVQRGGFAAIDAPGTWALYRDFWGGGEVLVAWAMLPFHDDTLAMAGQAACWLALGLATLVLARELGAREPYASSAAALVLATPTIRLQAATGYVEVVELLFMTSGLAFAVRFARRNRPQDLPFAGAALGLAAGVKFPCAPPAALALALLVGIALWKRRSLERPLVWVAAAATAAAAGVLPWLGYAIANSGAPFSPVPINVLGIELGRANPETLAHLAHPIPPQTLASAIDQLGTALFRGYESPGAAAAVVALLGIVAIPRLSARGGPGVAIVATVLIASIAEYFSSGLATVRHEWPASSVRFLLVPLVLGIVLSAAAQRRGDALGGRAYLWLVWGAAAVHFGTYAATSITPACASLVLGLGLLAALLVIASRGLAAALPSRARAAAGVGALAIFLTAGAVAHERARPEMARVGFVSSPIPPYWLRASRIVDEPDRPRRIAVTSGPWVHSGNWFAYPLLGSRLQNEVTYVALTRDGRVQHFGLPAVDEEYARTADYASWLERLGDEGIDLVMSFSPPSIELGWMEDHPDRFRRLDGDPGDWGLFERLR